MKRMEVFVLASLLAACGSGSEQQEASYRHKLESVDKLIARAEGETKAEIQRKKAEWEAAYAALPKDEEPRGTQFGRLHQEMHAAMEAYEQKVAAAEAQQKEKAAAQAGAERQKRIAEIAGKWSGGGIELRVGEGGNVSYKSRKGVVEKSLDGSISRIDDRGFEAGAFGLTTTFRIDVKPHQDGGRWRMTVDGTELTRLDPP